MEDGATCEGAFAVDRNGLPLGCEVLLVDDIYTTGATARECARVLRRAGARKVWVATLARAQTASVALWMEASSCWALDSDRRDNL